MGVPILGMRTDVMYYSKLVIRGRLYRFYLPIIIRLSILVSYFWPLHDNFLPVCCRYLHPKHWIIFRERL